MLVRQPGKVRLVEKTPRREPSDSSVVELLGRMVRRTSRERRVVPSRTQKLLASSHFGGWRWAGRFPDWGFRISGLEDEESASR